MQAVERAIAAVAGDQENVISREQLLAAGLRRGAIEHRARAGSIHPVHRSVYLLGHAPPTQLGRAWAAALACGENAVVSHRSAAVLWGILPAHDAYEPEVTVIERNPRRRPGIVIHRAHPIHASEIRHIGQLPVTSPARTICDLAGSEPSSEVEHALQEARVHLQLSEAELNQVIDRAPTKKGAAFIRRLLQAEDDSGYTRSRAERLMRRLAGDAGLPQPKANVHHRGFLLDFVWEAERLVVEVDGYFTHGDRAAFERDRRRDQVLVAAGYRVIRITWRQLTEEPYGVIARLAQALAVAPTA